MDWTSWWTQLILAVVPVVTAFVVWGIRQIIPKIPRFMLPVLAMGLPLLLSLLTNYIGGHQFNPALVALLGAGATWLREIINTLKEHGTD